MLRVLCFGGRDYRDYAAVDTALSRLAVHHPSGLLIVNGGAPGADTLAKEWGIARGWPTITMMAAWGALGKTAGFVRNGWMLEHAAPQYAVEFPGGRGTADMHAKVVAAGITLWVPYA